MRERSARACALRVEVSTNGFLSLEDFLAGAISHRKLDVTRLAAGAHADHHPLGRITRTPASDGSIERVDCAFGSARRFVDYAKFFSQFDFEFRDELRLHQFHVVWQLNTLGDRERLDNQDAFLLRRDAYGRQSERNNDRHKSLHSDSLSTMSRIPQRAPRVEPCPEGIADC